MEINTILEIISEQFLQTMQHNASYYRQYDIILTSEQQYIKEVEKRNHNSIFIVVKFLSGQFNFGQYVQPISINVLGEQNKIEVVQKLLNEYVADWHFRETKKVGNDLVKQTYTSPNVMSNFNELSTGFRSLYLISGVFLIGENSNPIEKMEWLNDEGDWEEIPTLSIGWSVAPQLDPQAFYSTSGNTKSETRVSSLTLNCTLFHKADNFGLKLLELIPSDDELENFNININFKFKLTWGLQNNIKTKIITFKSAGINGSQNIGEFPVLSVAFAR